MSISKRMVPNFSPHVSQSVTTVCRDCRGMLYSSTEMLNRCSWSVSYFHLRLFSSVSPSMGCYSPRAGKLLLVEQIQATVENDKLATIYAFKSLFIIIIITITTTTIINKQNTI